MISNATACHCERRKQSPQLQGIAGMHGYLARHKLIDGGMPVPPLTPRNDIEMLKAEC